MPGRLITLTTDFGVRDSFVGVMKGVILGICPDARLVDLTHEIAPQDVRGAQLALESAVAFFPPGTIHLAVVDPGVGSARRPLALESGGQRFVGPDNGLFTFTLADPGWTAVTLEVSRYRLPEVSGTFHGRDVFAPAAAHLACGVALAELGPRARDLVRQPLPVARREGASLLGEVLVADRFGNLITSITVGQLRGAPGVAVEVGWRSLGALRATYAEGERDRAAPILGSQGRLEIFVRDGDARALLGAGPGTPVRVTLG
jgi:S-adenosylmethionine hydrolase